LYQPILKVLGKVFLSKNQYNSVNVGERSSPDSSQPDNEGVIVLNGIKRKSSIGLPDTVLGDMPNLDGHTVLESIAIFFWKEQMKKNKREEVDQEVQNEWNLMVLVLDKIAFYCYLLMNVLLVVLVFPGYKKF